MSDQERREEEEHSQAGAIFKGGDVGGPLESIRPEKERFWLLS